MMPKSSLLFIVILALSVAGSSCFGQLARALASRSLPRTDSINPSVWEDGDASEGHPMDELWLDLRGAPSPFAQMALAKLFYAVRSVVDKDGVVLPKGAGVQGVLYGADAFDPADALGAGLPIYLALGIDDTHGFQNATLGGGANALTKVSLTTIKSSSEWEALCLIKSLPYGGAEEKGVTAAALPPLPKLWARALTGANLGEDEKSGIIDPAIGF